MGITFNNIPGVGARALWEAIGSEAVERRHTAIRDYRYHEIAFAANRETHVYIRFAPSGSSTGGGGAGGYVSPYTVRHRGDLKILIATILAALPAGTGLGIHYFDNDVIYGEIANTDQSIVIDKDHVSIGYTGDGTRRPEITGFIPLGDGGPSGVGAIGTTTSVVGTLVTIDNSGGHPGVVVYWVRGRKVGSTSRDDYEDVPGSIAKDVGDCTANEFSFFSDGTTISVNCGSGALAWDPNTLEATTDTGPGFNFKNVADCSCDNVICGGNGMNAPFTAGGGQAIRFEGTGTNTFVRRNIKQVWGHYHCGGHFVTLGSGTGGISTIHDSEMGFHLWDQAGGGDADIAFNGDGGNEWGRYNCRQRRGGLNMTTAYNAAYIAANNAAYQAAHGGANLPTLDNQGPGRATGLSSGTPYGHAGTGKVCSYYYEIGCTWAAESGHEIVNDHMCGNVPAVPDKDLQTSYIGGSRDRRATAMGWSTDAVWGDHESYRFTALIYPPASGAFTYVCSAGALKGNFRNLEINLVSQALSWAGKSVRMFNSGTSDFRWIHPRLRLTGANCNSFAMMWAAGLQTCSVYNGAVSAENGATLANFNLTDAPGTNHFQEQTPGTGGILGLAHWNMQASQVNGLTGVVNLLAAADWTSAGTTPPAIRNASQLLPAGLDCWRDVLGARRHPNQTLRTLGPIEGNPLPDSTWRIDRVRDRAILRPV